MPNSRPAAFSLAGEKGTDLFFIVRCLARSAPPTEFDPFSQDVLDFIDKALAAGQLSTLQCLLNEATFTFGDSLTDELLIALSAQSLGRVEFEIAGIKVKPRWAVMPRRCR